MTMPSSTKKIKLRIRDVNSNRPWSTDNFQQMGWKVRNNDNTSWVVMGPDNTRIRNPEHDSNNHAVDDPDYPLWLEPAREED